MTKTFSIAALAAATLALAACAGPTAPVVAPVAPAAAPAAPSTPAATSNAGPAPAGPAAVADPGARVDVDDQSGDGTTVTVREARVGNPAWVVIRTDDDGGRVLGSAPVAPGAAGPLTVTLTEPVPADDDSDDDSDDDRDDQDDRDLTAVLHLDDGDGAFDPATDPRVLDDDDSDDADDDDRDDDVEDDDFDYTVR